MQNTLVDVCAAVGAVVPYWTQGPGGNISWKTAVDGQPLLWIKGSGLRLDEVRRDRGLACVQVEAFLNALPAMPSSEEASEQAYAKLLGDTAVAQPDQARPSMETGFHVLLKGTYVVHFHSLAAILLIDQWASEPGLRQWVSSELGREPVVVGAQKPGWQLSKALASAGTAPVILLQNHGVILQGATATVVDDWRRFEAKLLRRLGLPWLQDLVAAATPVQSLQLVPTPWRIYLPDTVVFADRIQPLLEAVGSKDAETLWQLQDDAFTKDRSAAELWAATALLYQARPTLQEMPKALSSGLASMPTEQLRRQQATTGGVDGARK